MPGLSSKDGTIFNRSVNRKLEETNISRKFVNNYFASVYWAVRAEAACSRISNSSASLASTLKMVLNSENGKSSLRSMVGNTQTTPMLVPPTATIPSATCIPFVSAVSIYTIRLRLIKQSSYINNNSLSRAYGPFMYPVQYEFYFRGTFKQVSTACKNATNII